MPASTCSIDFGGKRREVDFEARTVGAVAPSPAALIQAHATCLGFLSTSPQILRANLHKVLTLPFDDKVGLWADQVAAGGSPCDLLRLVACPADPGTQARTSRSKRHTMYPKP